MQWNSFVENKQDAVHIANKMEQTSEVSQFWGFVIFVKID